MNVMYVVDDPKYGRVVSPDGRLAYLPTSLNRFREIVVTDPDDVYGDPLYSGEAHLASKVLPVGTYWYEFADEADFTD